MLLQIRGTEWELYSTRDPGPNPLFIECSIHQSSCSDYHQILPTLKPNPAKWPPPPPPTIAFRYKVSIRDEPSPSPSSSSIELTSSGREKKKISSTNSFPFSPDPSSGSFRMKFPIIAFRETWRLATLHARFSRGAPIIKVIELVIAVIFHRFNPLPPSPSRHSWRKFI